MCCVLYGEIKCICDRRVVLLFEMNTGTELRDTEKWWMADKVHGVARARMDNYIHKILPDISLYLRERSERFVVLAINTHNWYFFYSKKERIQIHKCVSPECWHNTHTRTHRNTTQVTFQDANLSKCTVCCQRRGAHRANGDDDAVAKADWRRKMHRKCKVRKWSNQIQI